MHEQKRLDARTRVHVAAAERNYTTPHRQVSIGPRRAVDRKATGTHRGLFGEHTDEVAHQMTLATSRGTGNEHALFVAHNHTACSCLIVAHFCGRPVSQGHQYRANPFSLVPCLPKIHLYPDHNSTSLWQKPGVGRIDYHARPQYKAWAALGEALNVTFKETKAATDRSFAVAYLAAFAGPCRQSRTAIVCVRGYNVKAKHVRSAERPLNTRTKKHLDKMRLRLTRVWPQDSRKWTWCFVRRNLSCGVYWCPSCRTVRVEPSRKVSAAHSKLNLV